MKHIPGVVADGAAGMWRAEANAWPFDTDQAVSELGEVLLEEGFAF